jgi:hypothetical protein
VAGEAVTTLLRISSITLSYSLVARGWQRTLHIAPGQSTRVTEIGAESADGYDYHILNRRSKSASGQAGVQAHRLAGDRCQPGKCNQPSL